MASTRGDSTIPFKLCFSDERAFLDNRPAAEKTLTTDRRDVRIAVQELVEMDKQLRSSRKQQHEAIDASFLEWKSYKHEEFEAGFRTYRHFVPQGINWLHECAEGI